ncbi:hypothetical protein [Trinickia fusca]|uniref:Uncharacterized protein n=1 Tax=Trinickia fusca TaxID=2419777 RepID=A0A494X6G6_9BURK|nr:hypothetical protein [Trinickia fusca]RKP45902.1 hypothetical protein D7S89_18090 [Trinickia fusca]
MSHSTIVTFSAAVISALIATSAAAASPTKLAMLDPPHAGPPASNTEGGILRIKGLTPYAMHRAQSTLFGPEHVPAWTVKHLPANDTTTPLRGKRFHFY